MLLEILQLLHFEKAFEEASIDYCITFEVSPPSFEAPKNNVTDAFPELLHEDEEAPSDRFFMPATVDGSVDALDKKIAEQAE